MKLTIQNRDTTETIKIDNKSVTYYELTDAKNGPRTIKYTKVEYPNDHKSEKDYKIYFREEKTHIFTCQSFKIFGIMIIHVQ